MNVFVYVNVVFVDNLSVFIDKAVCGIFNWAYRKGGSAMKTKNGNTKVLSFPTAKESLYNAEIEKEQNIVGERIDEARRKAKLTLPEFSALLADYGVKVSASGINKWVKGS